MSGLFDVKAKSCCPGVADGRGCSHSKNFGLWGLKLSADSAGIDGNQRSSYNSF